MNGLETDLKEKNDGIKLSGNKPMCKTRKVGQATAKVNEEPTNKGTRNKRKRQDKEGVDFLVPNWRCWCIDENGAIAPEDPAVEVGQEEVKSQLTMYSSILRWPSQVEVPPSCKDVCQYISDTSYLRGEVLLKRECSGGTIEGSEGP